MSAAERPLTEHQRQLRNERARRYHARQHPYGNGEIAPNIEIDNSVIELAINTGWVAMHESEDRKQIALGISKMLKDAGQSHRRQKNLTHTEARCPHCGKMLA